jgi:hypothetical protein
MAKKQTRRSISVMGKTYRRLVHHTDATGESVSGYIERLVKADLDAAGVAEDPGPQPHRNPANAKVVGDPDGSVASSIFTW